MRLGLCRYTRSKWNKSTNSISFSEVSYRTTGRILKKNKGNNSSDTRQNLPFSLAVHHDQNNLFSFFLYDDSIFTIQKREEQTKIKKGTLFEFRSTILLLDIDRLRELTCSFL